MESGAAVCASSSSAETGTLSIRSAVQRSEARITAYVVLMCIMVGSGGLIYGYDLVIAGGMSIMDDFLIKFYPDVHKHKINAKEDNYCKYDNQVFQLFSSSLYLAALPATFFASAVSEKLGRKVSMLLAGLFFICGTIIGTVSQNLAMIITGRSLLGCGIGFSLQAIPMYLVEIAPPNMRGMLNMLCTVYVVIGAMSGNIVNYVADKLHPSGWRLSLGVAGLPALLLTLCSLIVVETPTSLVQRGKLEEAKEVLQKIRGSRDIFGELDELVAQAERSRGTASSWEAYKQLFCERRHRGELVVACLLPFFQQVAGNDAILFYGPFLFKLAGFGDQASLYSAIIIGTVCLLTVSASLFFIDKVGRRHLLLVACIFMVSTQVVIGSLFAALLKGDARKLPRAAGITEVIMVCVFVMSFAGSIGPLAWLIPTEVLSQNVRSAGVSVVVFVNMLFKFLIAQTFLSMLCSFKFGVFFFFAGWGLVIATFVILFLPETSNVPLSEMENVWLSHWFWKNIVYRPSSPQQHQK
ncbi:hypothetical protein GOP47_0014826 [Adiantum capillus-veneris]|uniref:Major facilitator superfamily (MFS) profile domain-containing protein n=1 Tax=Adiantum capillus-veneris TaxID=13818 RepID=A0A9D4UM87_ADICA|nr:hypothetical protein GOP47_0014826 [Adiantum capillus-veneris]